MASSFPQGKKGYAMSEDQVKRLKGRHDHMDVLKNVQAAKDDFGNKKKKLQQAMYLHPVGTIPHYERSLYSKKYDSEIVEQYLENVSLYQNAEQLMEKRGEFAVIEDDFGPTLEKMMKDNKTPSFRNLIEACSRYDNEKDIKTHTNKSSTTYGYFIERGVSEDDARAYAFAIAFYTGAYSWAMSMEANVVCRRLVKQGELYADEAKVDGRAAMIMYYLIQGLSHIDFYWGVVVRYVDLTDKDLEDYKPGEIVTWLQFSSADKGGQDMQHFKDRNTIFTVSSLTGRSIRYFSNCGEAEDEILFLPHSSFLVCHVGYDENHRQHLIHLRQVNHFVHDLYNKHILI
ncbi:unnamed protein product [Adineta steineri]|uniref:NAD(P)(+)--arginine ADP-ribosyltransferase n=1 Tax=Adineta steineri TaxID=433720 RepID=A0A814KAQ2_9BILA|nr:unnamed protein product [Adineta steineri]CAF3502110.1 unnamed protein product [Adineta steineri]